MTVRELEEYEPPNLVKELHNLFFIGLISGGKEEISIYINLIYIDNKSKKLTSRVNI